MLARLTVHFPLRPASIALLRGERESIVGRDPQCDIVLDDDRVSRKHARIAIVGGAWSLTDLASSNGTSLNGSEVGNAIIDGSAWIGFGGLLTRFEPTTEEKERDEAARGERRRRDSLSLQREMSPILGVPRLVDRLLDSVLSLSGAARGSVLLKRSDGEMNVVASRGAPHATNGAEPFRGSAGAVERAIATLRPVTVSDARLDAAFQNRESIVGGDIRALVCLPLRVGDRVLGAVYADSPAAGSTFTELDVEILEGLTSQAALAIALALLDRDLASVAGKLRVKNGEGSTSESGKES